MIRPTPIRIALVTLVAACLGCPGSLEDPGRFADAGAACPDVPQDIFGKICSTSGCHDAVDKMGGLDLQSPNVTSRLVGVPSTGGPGLLINPSNPATSALYTKLTPMVPFGVRMPFNEPPLDDATIACVLDWITAQVADAGSQDGALASDATESDGPVSEGSASDDSSDDGSAPDDASVPDDASSPMDDAGSVTMDAGRAPDARVPMRDASSSGTPDASSVRDASPPADAMGD